MCRRPPRSTPFPTRRSSDLKVGVHRDESVEALVACVEHGEQGDRKSTRLNSSHRCISYAVFCLKKKKKSLRSYNKIHYQAKISPHQLHGTALTQHPNMYSSN